MLSTDPRPLSYPLGGQQVSVVAQLGDNICSRSWRHGLPDPLAAVQIKAMELGIRFSKVTGGKPALRI